MESESKLIRILPLAILIFWLFFLLFAIYQLWINWIPGIGQIDDDLRKLALAVSWGALGAWVRSVQEFMSYLRDVDENNTERSDWVSLFTLPLLYPVLGGVFAVAIVFLLLGTVTDDVRISGIAVISGLLFYELERRVQMFMPNSYN